MKVEIITTGDEVMQGIIVDTNTAWIAEKCASLGFDVVRHSSTGDDAREVSDVLLSAGKRADVVIVTGGLGPTADDITIEAAARAFGLKLTLNEAVLDAIRERFRKLGREMSKSNDKQAMIPEGATVLENRVGTAPGLLVKHGECEFYFLPGVPKELYQIFDDSVFPMLAAKSDAVSRERVIKCFGMPEATIDEKLFGLNMGDARLSFRVRYPEVYLKVLARGKDAAGAVKSVDAVASQIHERLGEFAYGEGSDELAGVVGRMLADRKMRIATAESCTGGLMGSLITDVAGSSEYFERGIVSYSNKSKMEMLGVSEKTLKAHGAVSAETAMSMADGIRRISDVDMGISITGIAGPGGGTPEKPVGLVFVGLSTSDGTWAFKYNYSRDRVWLKIFMAATAIDLIRRYLLGCLPENKV